MPSVLDWYDRQKFAVDRIIDTTFFRLLEDNESSFGRIAPVVNYADMTLLIMKLARSKPTIASLVGDEAELPNQRARVTITEELLAEARIGKQHIFKNNDFKAMRKLEEALQRANATELQSAFEALFFGIAADLPKAIVEKMTVLMIQIFTTGACNFTDPLTNVKMTVTYPGTFGTLMIPAVPTVNTQSDWGGTDATRNGLLDLENHAIEYYNRFGTFPSIVVMRWALLRDLAGQLTTKRAYGSRAGFIADGVNADAALGGIYLEDAQVIDLIRQRTRGAEVILLDSQYSEEGIDGTVTDKYFLDAKRYFFAEEGNAERAFVPTPEKNFESGIYVNTRVLNDAPRQERIAGVGAGIPAIFDDRKLAARQVRP